MSYNNEASVIHAVKYVYSNDCINHSDIDVVAIPDPGHPTAWACRVYLREGREIQKFELLVDSALLDPNHQVYRDPRNGSAPECAMEEVEFAEWPPVGRVW